MNALRATIVGKIRGRLASDDTLSDRLSQKIKEFKSQAAEDMRLWTEAVAKERSKMHLHFLKSTTNEKTSKGKKKKRGSSSEHSPKVRKSLKKDKKQRRRSAPVKCEPEPEAHKRKRSDKESKKSDIDIKAKKKKKAESSESEDEKSCEEPCSANEKSSLHESSSDHEENQEKESGESSDSDGSSSAEVMVSPKAKARGKFGQGEPGTDASGSKAATDSMPVEDDDDIWGDSRFTPTDAALKKPKVSDELVEMLTSYFEDKDGFKNQEDPWLFLKNMGWKS